MLQFTDLELSNIMAYEGIIVNLEFILREEQYFHHPNSKQTLTKYLKFNMLNLVHWYIHHVSVYCKLVHITIIN